MSSDYSHTPTVFRLFEENGEWFIDGFDTRTNKYTDAVWSYDTRTEALENVAEFIDLAYHYLITWEWLTNLEYRVGDTVNLIADNTPGTVVAVTDLEGVYLIRKADNTIDAFDSEFIEPYRG